jgi:hypothetical protein
MAGAWRLKKGCLAAGTLAAATPAAGAGVAAASRACAEGVTLVEVAPTGPGALRRDGL